MSPPLFLISALKITFPTAQTDSDASGSLRSSRAKSDYDWRSEEFVIAAKF